MSLHSHEASAIPHLLVAPKSGPYLPPAYDAPDQPASRDADPVDRSIYTTGHGDARGYYQDGAYTAAPSSSPSPPPSHSPTAHPSGHATAAALDAAYFAALTTRFHRLRTTLHGGAPPPSLAALPPSHTPHVGAFGPRSRTFALWTARLRAADPRPAQVAAMDKGAVLRLLRVLQSFLRPGEALRERTSRWLWALLARLPDRGELDHTEVGHVRELGKRAALLMHTLKEMAALRAAVELGAGDEEWEGEDEEEEEQEEEEQRDGVPSVQADERQDTPPLHLASDPARPSSTAATSVPDANDKNGKDDDDDVEEGEIADESEPMDLESDIESAKARLLANLESRAAGGSSSEGEAAVDSQDGGDGKGEEEEPFDPVRSRMNMRATLNMILTVAGEFYGQRDLLEFRDPFHGM